MKFINYLTTISGIEVYPMISFMMFFVFFLILILYVFKVEKQHIKELENIPFETENNL